MGNVEVGVELQGLVTLRDRLFVLSREEVHLRHDNVDDGRCRVELLGALYLREALFVPSHGREKLGIPLVRGRVVGLQVERAAELALRVGPVPLVRKRGPGE